MNCIRLLRLAEKQTANVYRITSAKLISNQHIKYQETQERWRDRDGLSDEWQLIYKAPMDKVLKFATTYLTFSTTSISCFGLYYGAFMFNEGDLNNPVILGDDVVIANSTTEYLVYIGAFMILHIAVKILLSRYVIRLYQNGDEYLAVFRGHMFNSIKKHQFHLKEFRKLNPTLVVTWGDARFGLGKKHGILLENYFRTPEYFNYLLNGTEKPDKED